MDTTIEITEKDLEQGHKADTGKPPLGLLPGPSLVEIAKVLDFGARKYDRHNWRKGIAWSRVYDAALRHMYAFIGGEDKDPETGLSHLAHAGCCVLFLLQYEQTHQEFDDRYGKGTDTESYLN